MTNYSVNLQDSFLNQVRKDGTEVEVALINGNSHKGLVRGFDNFTVIMHVDGKQHLVYKHAIAQIIAGRPARPQSLADAAGNESAKEPHPGRKPPAAKEKHAPKFNTLDLSHVKIEESNADGAEIAAPQPSGKKTDPAPAAL